MDSGSIQAPDVRISIDPPFPGSGVDWDGVISLNLDTGLVWSLYDANSHRLLYQSSEYTVSDDGCTARFTHTFPALGSGDTYTITQEVIVT